jgi:superoxide dismutase, Cu-Zn family
MTRLLLVLMSFMSLAGLAYAAEGTAVIKATDLGSSFNGNVTLIEEEDGVVIEGVFSGLAPGKHGFHVHENGSCAEAGKAAGGHYNPDHAHHGYIPQDGPEHAHPGDMGNIEAGPDGKGAIKIFLPGVKLNDGKYPIAGKSLIVHEKEDDFSQPTGNAGGRIGCGIIELVTKS